MKLDVTLIKNPTISDKTLAPFIAKLGYKEIAFPIYKTEYKKKTFYIALCGGLFKEDGLYLTEVGQAAFEGLANLKIKDSSFCIRELKGSSETIIEKKLIETFEKMKPNTAIAFIGDMAGELDEPFAQILNYSEKTISSGNLTIRNSISLSKRFDVFTRDNYKCRICGRSAQDGALLEVDHIIPKSKGGSDKTENLQTLCFECNRGKRNKWEEI